MNVLCSVWNWNLSRASNAECKWDLGFSVKGGKKLSETMFSLHCSILKTREAFSVPVNHHLFFNILSVVCFGRHRFESSGWKEISNWMKVGRFSSRSLDKGSDLKLPQGHMNSNRQWVWRCFASRTRTRWGADTDLVACWLSKPSRTTTTEKSSDYPRIWTGPTYIFPSTST